MFLKKFSVSPKSKCLEPHLMEEWVDRTGRLVSNYGREIYENDSSKSINMLKQNSFYERYDK